MSQELLVKVFSAVFSIGAILFVIYLIDIYARRKAERVLKEHEKEKHEKKNIDKKNNIIKDKGV